MWCPGQHCVHQGCGFYWGQTRWGWRPTAGGSLISRSSESAIVGREETVQHLLNFLALEMPGRAPHPSGHRLPLPSGSSSSGSRMQLSWAHQSPGPDADVRPSANKQDELEPVLRLPTLPLHTPEKASSRACAIWAEVLVSAEDLGMAPPKDGSCRKV